MSVVTNVILAVESLKMDEDRQVEKINEFFAKKNTRGFVSVKDPGLPRDWYGGNRFLETELYLGVFNYLDLEGLIDHIELMVPWKEPASVQLMVQGQEETRFKIIQVIDTW